MSVATLTTKRPRRRGSSLKTTWLHIMLLPAVIIVFIYNYIPMVGAIIAFEDYQLGLGFSGFWRSPWVGLYHFRRIFGDPDFNRAFMNTFRIAVLKLVTVYVLAILMSLLLNEIRSTILKRSIQTFIYLPHFLSWIIIAGILKEMLGSDGSLNAILKTLFDTRPRIWLSEPTPFLVTLIASDAWKEVGFSTIVYLAAITGIDPNLYEAAMMDGAGRWRQTIHVTLPGMMPIIILTGVLKLGSVLNAGFDQIYNLYSAPVYRVGDVIDTLAFRKGFQGGDYELGAAIGLFNSTIGFTLIVTSHYLARRFANYEIF